MPVATLFRHLLRRHRRSASRTAPPSLESLEDRLVPNAAIAPAWFQTVGQRIDMAVAGSALASGSPTPDGAAATHEWIVQLNQATLASVQSVAGSVGLFAGAPVDLIGGLGLEGQLLVRSTGNDAAAIQWLDQSSFLAYYEANVSISLGQLPNDASFTDLWGLHNTGQNGGTADADIDAPEAWDISTGSSAVVVAVIDSGFDYTHPDLADNIWTNPGETAGDGLDNDGNGFIDDVHGYDFVNNDGTPLDDNGHGTHVSGTIGAAGNNGAGVTGVSWDVSLMGLKFLNSAGSGTLDNAVRAVNYATLMKTTYGVNVRLTNNSWGGSGTYQALSDAIQASGTADILFVAAAGNNGTNNDTTPFYPASYPLSNVVSVAATDRNDRLADFSNYGVVSVDLAAPGVSIYSTLPGGQYGSYNGTSMATPHVTGALALLSAVNPSLTAAQLRDRLMNTTDYVGGLVGKVATAGRLNAYHLIDGSYMPPAVDLNLAAVVVSDAGGNNNGTPNPGETVTVRPTLFNHGIAEAGGVSVQLVAGTGATVVGSSTLTVGTVGALQSAVTSGSFQVQLSSTLTDLTAVPLQFVVTYTGGTSETLAYSFRAVKLLPQVEAVINFAPGATVADPIRNLVYVVDKTNMRLLAIDTDLGRVVAQAALAGSPNYSATISSVPAEMTVAQDGTRLYVALPLAKKIQVFDLPTLTSVAVWDYSFGPFGVAIGANNRLYASTTDSISLLKQIDAQTGAVVREFGKVGNGGTYFPGVLLRTSADGTRLYAGEADLWTVGGPNHIDEYDISGTGMPTRINFYPYNQVYMKDYAVDAEFQRIYTMNTGLAGIQVTDLATGSYGQIWDLQSPGPNAVATRSDSPFVYGASQGYTTQSNAIHIRRFDRADGSYLGDYLAHGTQVSNAFFGQRSLELTPNGHLLYFVETYTGTSTWSVGFIGGASIDLSVTPRVVSIAPTGVNPTNAATVNFRVTFDTSVAGVDPSDFVLTTTGLVGASISSITPVSGSVYDVLVNAGAGTGTVRLDVVDDDTIRNGGGVPLGLVGLGGGNFAVGTVVTVDRTPPAIESIVRASADPTSAAIVNFTVTFSENVTGVDASDFVVTTNGLTSAAVTAVAIQGAGTRTYSVGINPGIGAGTARLDLIDNDSIRDAALNSVGGAGAGNGNYTTGQFYTVNRPVSLTSIALQNPATNNLAAVNYLVNFNTAVTGLDATDFVLAGTGLSGAAITGVTAVTSTQYRVTVGTGTGSGTLRLDVVDDDSIRDSAGNTLGGPGAGNGNYSAGPTYTIDRTPPAVASSVRLGANPAWTSQVTFTVTFSETVTGVNAADFSLTTTGITGASIASVTALNGTTYNVVVNTGAGNGTIRLNVTASNPNLNSGADTTFGASNNFESFLRFNLATLTGSIASARLVLTTTTAGSPTTYQLQLVENDTWIEGNGGFDNNPVGEMVWGNRPTGSTVLATWTGEIAGTTREIDITAAVQQQLAADPGKKLSLRLSSSAPNTNYFAFYASREDATPSRRPQLQVWTNAAPTVATTAAALLNPVGTSAALSVLGADDAGEANLTYTWSVVGTPPAPVTFAANGSNAARSTTANFTALGAYNLRVTIADAGGLTATSTVTVVVNPVLTSSTVSPANPSTALNGSVTFTATGFDQFGQALASPPAFAWSVSAGGGSINAAGQYTAPATPGSYTVTATSGSVSGSTTVTVSNTAPTLAGAATASPNPVTSAALSVLGADDAGESSLTYTWTLVGGPAPVFFSENGSNAAKNTTALFSQVGTYTFRATISDSGGLTATSDVGVTVNPVMTAVAVSPSTATVNSGATQQFAAAATDQFGQATSTAFTWSIVGGGVGSVDGAGLYTAPASGSGSATVRATSNGVSGAASVTVQAATTDTVWVDDALPAGASPSSDGGDAWTWVSGSPTPFSGSLAHQSSIASGEHQHYFTGASATLTVGAGATLFAYVYLDPANPPSEVMLQWRSSTEGWNHRAYWGSNAIPWGSDGTQSRRFMGALPATGAWVRLEVAASAVGLEGKTVTGMAFTLHDGRATWDKAGLAVTATAPTTPTGLASLPGNGQATLTWAAVSGATTYNVYRSTVSGGQGSTPYQTGITGTSFTDTGLTNGTTYYYQVAAVNGVGTSPKSAEVSATPAASSDVVWVDDALPAGAIQESSGGDAWTWVTSNPAPYSGSSAHQSILAAADHQHYFYNATSTLSVAAGDSLFAYVYLDPANPPSEVMLQWHSSSEGWNHRAYWGSNSIPWGTDGTSSRRYQGVLPAAGGWVRLEVAASAVGLEGKTVNGMAFTLYGGRATWDKAGLSSTPSAPQTPTGLAAAPGNAQVTLTWTAVSGATSYNIYRSTTSGGQGSTPYQTGVTGTSFADTSLTNGTTYYYQVAAVNGIGVSAKSAEINATPAPSAEVVWVDDAIPAGATQASDGGDAWTWSSSPAPYSGSLAHQSNIASDEHQHYFYGATSTLSVAAGDTLFAYVYLDPANPPSEVMLQWNDGSWEHRAYWGSNSIGWGADGTVSRRFMGALPATGGWVKLEVPAGLVGLEGRTLNGMAFTLYGGRATWDRAGKESAAAAAASAGSAAFVGSDTTTQGNWQGVYGSAGYQLVGNSTSLPASTTLTPVGQSDYTWAGSTSDVRALEKATGGDRLASCWYSGASFDVRLAFTDAAAHEVSLYFLDWDNYGSGGRRQRIEVLDSATGQVLDSRELSSFQNGVYLTWNVSGSVTFRITNLNSNAVLSGLFVDS